jgi:threonylcarbamoyladenosine tRNA methylthiotransferase MtaB
MNWPIDGLSFRTRLTLRWTGAVAVLLALVNIVIYLGASTYSRRDLDAQVQTLAANDLLSAMRRPYTIERYAALVDTVRRRMPDAAIGSDLIVGFPGETDAQADALATYLETSPLTHLHVFPYSDRPGTEAEALPGKVHGAVVKARAQRLRDVSRALATRFRAAQTGRVRPALTIDDGRTAVTDNYLRVPVPVGRARNEWIDVVVPPPDDAVPTG